MYKANLNKLYYRYPLWCKATFKLKRRTGATKERHPDEHIYSVIMAPVSRVSAHYVKSIKHV